MGDSGRSGGLSAGRRSRAEYCHGAAAPPKIRGYRDQVTTTRAPSDHRSSANATLIKQAFEGYARGDLAAVLDLVDPDLEWTYLDPAEADPQPQVCHGRHELEHALERQRRQGLRSVVEEVIGHGDKVMVVTHTPGLDALRARQADDRNFDVFTMRDGRVVALRAFRDRTEALAFAGMAAR